MHSGDLDSVKSPSKSFSILRNQTKLVMEVCHFTEDLNPLWDTRSTFEQLKALSGPIIQACGNFDLQQDKFTSLTQAFFESLSFQVSKSNLGLQDCFLPQVLTHRKGPTPLIMLLFCSLAEEVGIRTQVSSCRLRFLLKVQLDDKTHVVDFSRACAPLEPFEIVDLINKGFDFSNGSLSPETLVVEYLNGLKALAREENKLQILSMVHSYLMRYQPFNLRHVSERARVAYETGDYRTAIDDIRSYFLYKQPEFNNLDLKRIYKMALRRVRHLEN